MPYTPISDDDLKLCVEGLTDKHEYDVETPNGERSEELVELIEAIKDLGHVAADVETMVIFHEGEHLIEIRVYMPPELVVASEALDPQKYVSTDEKSFGELVRRLIDDIGQTASETRDRHFELIGRKG